MKIKIAEASELVIDFLVAKCEGATAKYVASKLGDEVEVPDELLCTP